MRTLKAKPAQAALSNDGRRLAATQEGTLHVWDAETGKAVQRQTALWGVEEKKKDKLEVSPKPRDERELNDAVDALKTTLKTLRETLKGEEVQKIEKALKERLDRLQKELAEQVKIRQNIMQLQMQDQAIRQSIEFLQQQHKTGGGKK